jgi:Na+/proline symporter
VDRFRSPTLHAWATLALAGPTLIYLAAQVISLVGLSDGMFQGLLPAFPTALVLCAFMVGYEWFGGMAAIAYTDVFQTSVMFIGSMVSAFVVKN